MENNFKDKIDELFYSTGRYRKSIEFKEFLDFCRRFHYLSAYNAMLVHIQRPGTKYVQTANYWLKKHNLKVKPTARPLIILVPFGPVDYVFDVDDLEGVNLQNLPQEILNPYKTQGVISNTIFNHLLDNLIINSIRLEKITFGTQQSAEIRVLKNITYKDIYINYNKSNSKITVPEYYQISVNNKGNNEELFAAIAHELAHLFCEHLSPPITENWWKVRQLSHNIQEFEAETVAWIICERFGIKNPSAEYLSGYLETNDQIPNISLESVLKAITKIEAMLKSMPFKMGLLAKEDRFVREQLQKINKNNTIKINPEFGFKE